MVPAPGVGWVRGGVSVASRGEAAVFGFRDDDAVCCRVEYLPQRLFIGWHVPQELEHVVQAREVFRPEAFDGRVVGNAARLLVAMDAERILRSMSQTLGRGILAGCRQTRSSTWAG